MLERRGIFVNLFVSLSLVFAISGCQKGPPSPSEYFQRCEFPDHLNLKQQQICREWHYSMSPEDNLTVTRWRVHAESGFDIPVSPQERSAADQKFLNMKDSSQTSEVLQIVLVGILMVGGLAWQVALLRKDDAAVPQRVVPTMVIALVLAVGVAGVSTLGFFDETRRLTFFAVVGNVFRATALGGFLIFKSYLAPLVTAFVASSLIYGYMTYGAFQPVPIIQSAFEWALSGAPHWLSWAYVICTSLYMLGCSVHDLS